MTFFKMFSGVMKSKSGHERDEGAGDTSTVQREEKVEPPVEKGAAQMERPQEDNDSHGSSMSLEADEDEYLSDVEDFESAEAKNGSPRTLPRYGDGAPWTKRSVSMSSERSSGYGEQLPSIREADDFAATRAKRVPSTHDVLDQARREYEVRDKVTIMEHPDLTKDPDDYRDPGHGEVELDRLLLKEDRSKILMDARKEHSSRPGDKRTEVVEDRFTAASEDFRVPREDAVEKDRWLVNLPLSDVLVDAREEFNSRERGVNGCTEVEEFKLSQPRTKSCSIVLSEREGANGISSTPVAELLLLERNRRELTSAENTRQAEAFRQRMQKQNRASTRSSERSQERKEDFQKPRGEGAEIRSSSEENTRQSNEFQKRMVRAKAPKNWSWRQRVDRRKREKRANATPSKSQYFVKRNMNLEDRSDVGSDDRRSRSPLGTRIDSLA